MMREKSAQGNRYGHCATAGAGKCTQSDGRSAFVRSFARMHAKSPLSDESMMIQTSNSKAMSSPQCLFQTAATPSRAWRKRAGSYMRTFSCCAALPAVMVNGLTGRMGFACAEAALRRGLHLVPVAFSGAFRRGPSPSSLRPFKTSAASRAGDAVECGGVRVALQPYDSVALEALRQSHPARSFCGSRLLVDR